MVAPFDFRPVCSYFRENRSAPNTHARLEREVLGIFRQQLVSTFTMSTLRKSSARLRQGCLILMFDCVRCNIFRFQNATVGTLSTATGLFPLQLRLRLRHHCHSLLSSFGDDEFSFPSSSGQTSWPPRSRIMRVNGCSPP